MATHSGHAAAQADLARLFLRHRGKRFGFLLRGRQGDAAAAFAGSEPCRQLVVERSGESRCWDGARWRPVAGDPVQAVETFVRESASGRASEPTPGFDALPRTVGYLSYELGTFVERVPAVRADSVGLPLAVLSTYREIDVATADGNVRTVRFSDAMRDDPVPGDSVALRPVGSTGPGSRDAAAARRAYENGFDRIARAIRAGEIYQANLTRRTVFEYRGNAFDLWRRLHDVQPVPYAAFLDLGEAALLGNSPELFLGIRGHRIRTRPIKGTRPRSKDPGKDRELAAELAADAKEAAEHVMIVDLERNDLGRVCTPASVEVRRLAGVSSYATVHHLESEVAGELRPDVGLADILRATFPGGSITGAPKIKSMEIISEVEPEARGVYTGAVGWFDGERCAELNVAIRTAVATGNRVHYGVGGGIVADSDPRLEWEETMTKSRALLEAIDEAERERRAAAS